MRFVKKVFDNPFLAIIAGFMATVVVGTAILLLPISTNHGISLIDALFTATSAVCVTGLTVQDTGSVFTTFGQWMILVLMEIGGLGILTFSAFCIRLLTGRLGFSARSWLQESLTQNYVTDFYAFLKKIFLFVFIVEITGAFLLFLQFVQTYPWKESLFLATFHSISAFCNAGFSPFSDNLMQYRASWYLNGIIMILIVLGGIGFVVVDDVYAYTRKKVKSLSFHSRLVLNTSLILIVCGTILTFFLERNHSFASFSTSEQILVSLFHNVSARTAGFNSINIATLSCATIFLIIILMFIGASPGSTAGGIKTTSFAVLVMLIVSRMRGRPLPEIFKRTISWKDMERTLTLFLMAILFTILATFLLLVTESDIEYLQKDNHKFLTVLFEVVSALGTVGLSLGITPYLTITGKLVVICLMFIGRVGPLTLAILLTDKKEDLDYQYPEEDVMVG